MKTDLNLEKKVFLSPKREQIHDLDTLPFYDRSLIDYEKYPLSSAPINKNNIDQFVSYCKYINLDLIGLMCIPPVNNDPEIYFEEMNKLKKKLNFIHLSMGMSSDYLLAAKHSATFVRIGSSIFGDRG